MTELLYLQNQNLFETEAKIVNIMETENGTAIILDKTIFYVQGGGQPSDTGFITTTTNSFEVTKVIYNLDGEVYHLGHFTNGDFKIGDLAVLKVNQSKRQLHSKIHSAGHLIDLAIKNLSLDWLPIKGFHYPEGSYVEYSAARQIDNLEQLKIQIQSQFDKLVAQKIPIIITFDNNQLYKGLPLRKMSFDGLGELPCGGTHVANTAELEGFKITKIKPKQGVVKVSYGNT